MKSISMFFLVLLLLSPPLSAAQFDLQLTRKGADLYFAPAEDLFIQTQYCFAYVDNAEAQLVFNTEDDKLIFNSVEETCEVEMIYGKAGLEPGEYQFPVTWVSDNWFQIVGQPAALHTDGCLTMVEDAAARVVMESAESGTLSLTEVTEECAIVGVYSRAELSVEEVPANPAVDKAE